MHTKNATGYRYQKSDWSYAWQEFNLSLHNIGNYLVDIAFLLIALKMTID